jgi:hypothetical protein
MSSNVSINNNSTGISNGGGINMPSSEIEFSKATLGGGMLSSRRDNQVYRSLNGQTNQLS